VQQTCAEIETKTGFGFLGSKDATAPLLIEATLGIADPCVSLQRTQMHGRWAS